jgi:hypothetical protein
MFKNELNPTQFIPPQEKPNVGDLGNYEGLLAPKLARELSDLRIKQIDGKDETGPWDESVDGVRLKELDRMAELARAERDGISSIGVRERKGPLSDSEINEMKELNKKQTTGQGWTAKDVKRLFHLRSRE